MLRPTVCVDLDGTLIDFSCGWKGLDHFGTPFPGAVEFTKRLVGIAHVVIYTCRCTEELCGVSADVLREKVRAFLDRHGFSYHDIFVGQGKPIAHAMVDDRAVACRPMVGTSHDLYAQTFNSVKELIDGGL